MPLPYHALTCHCHWQRDNMAEQGNKWQPLKQINICLCVPRLSASVDHLMIRVCLNLTLVIANWKYLGTSATNIETLGYPILSLITGFRSTKFNESGYPLWKRSKKSQYEYSLILVAQCPSDQIIILKTIWCNVFVQSAKCICPKCKMYLSK